MRRRALLALLVFAVLPAAGMAAPGPTGHIAYSFRYFPKGSDSWEIFVVNGDGSGNHDVSRNSRCDDWGPAIDNFARHIAFVCRNSLANGASLLSVMDLDGRHVRRLARTTDFHGEFAGYSWSPAGNRLAFANRGVISTVELATGSIRWLAEGVGPAWSPDGRVVAFTDRGYVSTVDVVTRRSGGSFAGTGSSSGRRTVAGLPSTAPPTGAASRSSTQTGGT